ncbi:V-type ATP synthase subunit D [Candidatus Geothermarchaeota archaeon ex4572_27]|nr:MAG: V-type ATP synthase subunit D [Candidatus Geothermarchaeota archaeon ex4572_27]
MSAAAGGLEFKPTRMELIALRRKRKLAERGLALLKEKRDALVMELLEVLREYRSLKEAVDKSMAEAFRRLAEAKMELGALKLMELASSAPPVYDVRLRLRSVMGVKVPTLTLVEAADPSRPPYGMAGTCSSLDAAVRAFREVLSSIVRLAEVEASIRGLAEEVKRAKRRVNALESVIIPRFDRAIKYIELYLDERAREDVFRIRLLKGRRARR